MNKNNSIIENFICGGMVLLVGLIVGTMLGHGLSYKTDPRPPSFWKTTIEPITPTQTAYSGRLLNFERKKVQYGELTKSIDFLKFYDDKVLAVPSGAFHVAHYKDQFVYVVFDSTSNDIVYACLAGNRPEDTINLEWDKKQQEIDLKIKSAETVYKAKCEVLKAQQDLTDSLVKAYDEKQGYTYDSKISEQSVDNIRVVKGKLVSSTIRSDDPRWVILTFDGGEKIALYNNNYITFKEGSEYVLKYGVSMDGYNVSRYPYILSLSELPKKK